MKIAASKLLREALLRHKMHLSVLVAETAIWANPEIHHRQIRTTGSPAMNPSVRRYRPGENRGQVLNGIRLDDNSYANLAIKKAVALELEGFETCHIWPRTCYNPHYHTAIANIVLLPRAIAGLSDHDPEVQTALQYRAFELYNWWPEEFPKPQKPAFYPTNWRAPEADRQRVTIVRQAPERKRIVSDASIAKERELPIKIQRWANASDLNVHKIISIVAKAGRISRKDLEQRIAQSTNSKTPYGAISSLLTNKGNSYGHVFHEENGMIQIRPELEKVVGQYQWH